MSTAAKVVLGVIVALVLAVAVLWWRLDKANVQLRTAAVAPAQARADIATAKVETVTVRLAAQRDTVTRVLTRVRVDTFLTAPKTPEDTAKAAAQLPGAVAQLDTVTRACKAFLSDCDRFRAAAIQKFAADSALIAAERKARVAPQRRVLLGITAGFGGTLSNDPAGVRRLYTGPSLTAGLTWRVF